MSSPDFDFLSEFAKDVHEGLSAPQKFLSSRYFYDATGDKIFQQIMNMPEYYLTKCEFEIFDTQKDDILSAIHPDRKFNLVELGAGDGYKTKILLEHFLKEKADFEYFPVDISADVLFNLGKDLSQRFPKLRITSLNYEYFGALERLNELDDSPKVILFLGSNIGNFTPERARSFFDKLNKIMRPDDKLLSGIDLKKNPNIILKAYNDPAGITHSFNLNLLERMNRELGANFDMDYWDHFPTYDPFTGECRSYLMSCKKQDVTIKATGHTYSFRNNEPVHMEISRKYRLDEIEALARSTGFSVNQHFTDSKNYFVDSLWNKQ